MIYDDIKNYHKQFAYEPKVENAVKLRPVQSKASTGLRHGAREAKKFVVVGMGGSHLAADLLKTWKPELDFLIWKSYGLPPLKDLKDRLVIVSSYSGTTEETIDAFNEARKQHLAVAVIAARGKLLVLAE